MKFIDIEEGFLINPRHVVSIKRESKWILIQTTAGPTTKVEFSSADDANDYLKELLAIVANEP